MLFRSEEECESIDAKGLYVSPGFIDIHTYGGNGFDYMAGTLEAFVAATTLHLQHGATSIVPTTVAADTEYTIEFLHRFDQLKDDAKIPVRLLGVHLEGPYLALEQKGAIPAQYIKNPQKEEYLENLNIPSSTYRTNLQLTLVKNDNHFILLNYFKVNPDYESLRIEYDYLLSNIYLCCIIED